MKHYSSRGAAVYGWRDNCPHVVECGTEEECNQRSASDAAPTSDTNTAKEQDPMPKKPKKTNLEKLNEARDAVSEATAAPEGAFPSPEQAKKWADEEAAFKAKMERDEADAKARREEERALVRTVAAGLMELAYQQTKTLRAERFQLYSDALLKLRSCGAFPAIEQLQSSALHELTELSRELHAERVAARSDVKPASEVTPS